MRLHYTRQLTPECIKPELNWADVQRAINVRTTYWSPDTEFTYHFIGGNAKERQHTREGIAKIKAVAPGIKFKEVSTGGLIRIAFTKNIGSWSYVGSDCARIDQTLPTTNLGWQEDSHRVVIHEWLHVLNFSHEHLRGINFDWDKLYAKFSEQGWSKETVDHNFNPDLSNHDVTEKIDNASIMKYYISCDLTLDNKNCGQSNKVLSQGDIKRLNELFPPQVVEPPTEPPTGCLGTFLPKLFTSKSRLNKLTEPQVVLIANELGIEASTSDYKRDTVNKVWTKITSNI